MATKKEADEKKAWLKKTRNSPAAQSGAFTDDERWALYKKSRSKGTSKQKTSKSSTSEVKRPVGNMGGRKSRYSSGVDTTADKKRKEEREAAKKARIERAKAKNRRRGGGVRNRTDNPIGGGKKSVTPKNKKQKKSNLRITTWRDLE